MIRTILVQIKVLFNSNQINLVTHANLKKKN